MGIEGHPPLTFRPEKGLSNELNVPPAIDTAAITMFQLLNLESFTPVGLRKLSPLLAGKSSQYSTYTTSTSVRISSHGCARELLTHDAVIHARRQNGWYVDAGAGKRFARRSPSQYCWQQAGSCRNGRWAISHPCRGVTVGAPAQRFLTDRVLHRMASSHWASPGGGKQSG